MQHDLDAAAVRRWASACVRALDEHRKAIDDINVFPVADQDTGTNLLRTMRAGADAVARAEIADVRGEDQISPLWSALASGALAGARGNSGVILSQVLRGFAEVFGRRPDDVATAFRRADELATMAVSEPAPGTMLTVLHAAAQAAAGEAGSLGEVVMAASKAAERALAATTSQLEALTKAGVVDAGALGLVLVLAELAEVTAGRETNRHTAAQWLVPVPPHDPEAPLATREAGSLDYAYEVMYALADVSEPAASVLRGSLDRLGDCVSVVEDGAERWAVHVHCNDVGAVIEAGIEAGRPHRIAVVRFDDEVPSRSSRFSRERAVVALTRAEGIAELFRAEGAVVLKLPESVAPDFAELVAVITGTQASHVTVLPNESDLVGVLDEVSARATQAGFDVLVVPTASPVQGLAALAVHDPSRRAVDDVVAMAEAAAATRRGALVLARQEAITWVGRCQPDDVLGLLDGEVVLIEPGPPTERALLTAARGLVDRMLSGGGELVTALFGATAPAGLIDALTDYVRTEHREVELTGYPGGQADPVLLLGVE